MYRLLWSTLLALLLASPVQAGARLDYPPMDEPKVVFEFYFDEPDKINAALYWLRSFLNPLLESPYELAPEFMNVVVVMHGTEIVSLAKHNYQKYHDAVERMRYYSQLGVRFRTCALAADDFGYRKEDFQDFVEIAPSAMIDLAYWQSQGYALIKPEIMAKKFNIEEIR